MRNFKFVPTYYEWHLVDESTDTLLHVMEDPAENTVHEDGNTPLTLEELTNFCYDELDAADDCYTMNEEYNGIIPDFDNRLTSEEMKAAARIMAQALYDFYISEKTDDEPLEF